jgi:hypothetical protein
MSDTNQATIIELGGLKFDISTRSAGATLRVLGKAGGDWSEMLRFDDFIEPHYHVPASGPSIDFDRSLGEPLAWYIGEIRDHLAEWISRAGFEEVIPTIDFEEVSKHSDMLNEAMSSCIPSGCVRVQGFGLRRDVSPE